MTEKEKQQFINVKSKSWLVAKLIIRKKEETVWNLSENCRIANQLKKYEKEDIDTLSVLYEYLFTINKIPKNISIYKLIIQAKENINTKRFTTKVIKKPAVDYMKFL